MKAAKNEKPEMYESQKTPDMGNTQSPKMMAANPKKEQTLDELLKDKADIYEPIRGLVTDIKMFESNHYKNLSDLSKDFATNYSNYISNSPLSKDPKTLGFAKGLNAMLNSPENADKRKEYMQKIIDYVSAPLSVEYNRISQVLKPQDYHNIARGSINDPMIMFNPFMQNMKNELSKNDVFDRGLKLSQLANDIKTSYDKNDFSKLGDYFDRIPYDRKVFKDAGLSEQQIDKMTKTQNDLFRSMSENLKEENKKQLMESLIVITASEGSKQLSNGDKNHAMNAIKAANPDPVTGLYLALNAGSYGGVADKMSAAYSPQMNAEGMGYDMGGSL